jgi:hypothetical protein
MILIVCLPCSLAIRVLPSSTDTSGELDSLVGRASGFWPDQYECPRCQKKMRGLLERDANPHTLRSLELKDLTPQEAFQLFSGLGFPEEQNCTLVETLLLMKEQPVRKLRGVDIEGSPKRFILEEIELWDGSRVFLGSSPDGAVVYRIARPDSAVARLERAERNA